MNRFNERSPLKKISQSEDIFLEYENILKELREMEKHAKYSSENQEPILPPNGGSKEDGEQKFFTGFDKKIGIAEFCFGKKDNRSGYQYLTQEYFDKMVEKSKQALDALKKVTG